MNVAPTNGPLSILYTIDMRQPRPRQLVFRLELVSREQVLVERGMRALGPRQGAGFRDRPRRAADSDAHPAYADRVLTADLSAIRRDHVARVLIVGAVMSVAFLA